MVSWLWRVALRIVLIVFGGALGVTVSARALADERVLSLIMSDSGFNSEILPILREEVAKQGFELKWVVVNDIIQPNKLVDEGAADSNSFQHEPYFDQFVRDHGLKNVTRGFYTLFTPSGLYSRRYRSLAELPEGASVGIPVDPANNGRALFMLRDQALLSLRDGVTVTHASVRDVTANPRHFRFMEVDQQMLLRTLDSVDVGFLFAGNAVLAGIDPRRDALALEEVVASPYKGIVAVNRSVLGSPKVEALRRAYDSDAIKAYFFKRYGDAIIFLDYLNTPAANGAAAASASASSTAGKASSANPSSAAGTASSPTAPSGAPAPLTWRAAIANIAAAGPELRKAALETLFMLGITIPLAVLLGTPLGTVLFITRPGSLADSPRVYVTLNGAVNFVRSFPFLILLIALIPLTKLLVGSALGTLGAIVPMVINSIPYFARFVEQNLLEVNRGAIEAAESMGASRVRIVWSVLYAEARSGIAGSITILTVSFLSYSTVAGLVGGGGIGDFAIRYGYYRYQTDVMIFTIVVIIALVQLIQFTGNRLVRRLDKRV